MKKMISLFVIQTICLILSQSCNAQQAGSDFTSKDINVNGLDRQFFYHIPKGYRNRPTPLVFFFHGGGGEALNFASNIHASTTSDQNDFIAVAPQGYDKHWNYGEKVKGKTNEPDVKFVNFMIGYMQKNFNVDPRRIYIAGFSDGGWFTQWLTYQIPEKIAAAGVVCSLETTISQQTFGYSHPQLPIVFMLGTSDPRMLWNGGFTPNGTEVISAEATVHSWVRADHCFEWRGEDLPNISHADGSHVQATFYFNGCSYSPDVAFYRVIGGGHTWPGGNKPINAFYGNVNEDIDGTKLIWEFFNKHPKLILNEPQPFPRAG